MPKPPVNIPPIDTEVDDNHCCNNDSCPSSCCITVIRKGSTKKLTELEGKPGDKMLL